MLTVALIGAGARGMHAYGTYALEHPEEVKIIAVAEVNKERREVMQEKHNISIENVYDSWQALLEQPKLADIIIIANNDEDHYTPTQRALEKGYHVLLEKPMSNRLEEVVKIGELAKKYKDQVINVCHVLRYTPIYNEVKKIIDSKELGDLVSLQHNENIAYWHFSHSFARGNWRNSDETSPLILAKSCHDMDLLLWLVGSSYKNVASFGELTHFKNEKFKQEMTGRCLTCKVEENCKYSAKKFYLSDTPMMTSYLTEHPTKENLTKALEESNYGKCIYDLDNNVVDHMVMIMEYENGVTGTFNLSAFTNDCNRTSKFMFTEGEIRVHDEKNSIEYKRFGDNQYTVVNPKKLPGGHNGGDTGIMRDFIQTINEGASGKTSALQSVESHVVAFAAEHARLNKQVVNIKSFWEEAIEQN